MAASNTSSRASSAVVAVARPLLPTADVLMPYLRRIDASRTYSNQGTLVRELQDRLAIHFKIPSGTVAAVANATLGLTLTLSATGAQTGKLCLMPAWTFAASAHAVVAAGLQPYFLDVDLDTWTFSPTAVLSAVERLGRDRVGAVMPVAPFGSRIDGRSWDVFHEQTRIPVVIDAAAGFDTVEPTLVPSVVSLHATKVLGAGEGGFVLTRDSSLIVEVQRRANFGFWGAREARVAATNAKISEYGAAVALASLDQWPDTRARWIAVAQAYRKAMSDRQYVSLMPGLGEYASSTCVLRVASELGSTDVLALRMAALGISTRHWWGRGLQREPAFIECPGDNMLVTEELGLQTIGVPCSIDLPRRDVARVCEAMLTSLDKGRWLRESEPIRPTNSYRADALA